MKRAFFLGVSAMALACSTSAWADPAGAHRCAAHGAKSRQHNCPRPRRAAASDGVHEEIAQLRAEIADLRQQLAEQSAATTRLAAAPSWKVQRPDVEGKMYLVLVETENGGAYRCIVSRDAAGNGWKFAGLYDE